jgi:hypothetical protein
MRHRPPTYRVEPGGSRGGGERPLCGQTEALWVQSGEHPRRKTGVAPDLHEGWFREAGEGQPMRRQAHGAGLP